MFLPNFIPSSIPCIIPVFEEHRSRLAAGGLFFRSKDVGAGWNALSIETSESGNTIYLHVKLNNILQETYDVKATSVSVIDDLRNLITSQSNFIEMPIRQYDVYDMGTDPEEIEMFSGVFSGGSSGPIDGNDVDNIRSGPFEALICFKSTEDIYGNDIVPSIRIKKWDGNSWTMR